VPALINSIHIYDELIAYHGEEAAKADGDSGVYAANVKIKNELLHLKRTYIQYTEEQALLLLQAKIMQRLHHLRNGTPYEMEKRRVYAKFLAQHAKVPRATTQGVFIELKRYILENKFTQPFQYFCVGLFFNTITNSSQALRYDVTIPEMRDYIVFMIDYFETVGNDFYVNQRQIAIETFLEFLRLLQ
jgi:hypothetical protein